MKKCWYSRLLSLILAAALILPLAVPVRVAAATGGTFGSGLSWELEDGCLTISGNGAIPDYKDISASPWYDYRYEVTTLVLEEGITKIGAFALFGMENVTSVSLPESLTAIGDQGMAYMNSLVTLKLPASVETLGSACFGNCSALKNLYVYCYDAEFTWLPFGFRYDPGVNDYVEIEGVTLYGYTGSTAERYAEQYRHITFSPLNSGGISGSQIKTEVMERTDSIDLIHIRTAEELEKVADAPDAHYILDNDLTLSGEWVSIPLSGTFEGQGYTISGLNMTSSATGHYGLFSTLSGAVSNLTVEGSIRASGSDWIAAGLLAADCTGSIYHCVTAGSISVEAGFWGYAGGMTGRGGSFENCSSTASVALSSTSTTAWAHVGGLSGTTVAQAYNCSYDGDLSLVQTANASNMQAELRGIVAAYPGVCENCTVAGSMTMSALDCNAFVVALQNAVNSTNRSAINASGWSSINATACLDVINCTNSGAVHVTHSGYDGSANAVGFYNATDAINTGSIHASSNHADAFAVAIDSGYGADLSNTAGVEASAPDGHAGAYGIRAAAENCENSGIISADGKYASAGGLMGAISGSNGASISAEGETASAIGVGSSYDASNNGTVSAKASGANAVAYGVSSAFGRDGKNTAEVYAYAPDGSASAYGVQGGTSYINSGAVTASGKKALAFGLDVSDYGTNYAAITVECTSSAEDSTAQAFGLKGCDGSENRGTITAETSAALNKAVGCYNSFGCSSNAVISASGRHTVNAFGLQGCQDSFSSGTITAVCTADGPEDSASALGYTGGSCTSTATVSASSSYFLYVVTGVDDDGRTHYHWEHSGCEAGNAASASLQVPGLFNISQSGERKVTYYAWLTNACGVYGVFEREPTLEEVRATPLLQFIKYYDPVENMIYYVAYTASVAISTDGAPGESWTQPDPPEPEPEPEPEDPESTGLSSVGFYYSNDEDSRIHVMTNALGSFQFFNGTFDDFYDPSTTDFRTVYLRLRFRNSTAEDTVSDTATITLPEGFSFAENRYQQSSEIVVPALKSGESKDLWIPVHPLFSLDYRDGEELACSYSGSDGSRSIFFAGCRVNIPSGTAGQARVNYYLEKEIGLYNYVDYKWESGIFDQDNTFFHQNINELAALLSSIIYFTNDDPMDALDSLAALGFSCLRAGGSNTVQDCRHIVAQKTLLTEDGQVQQLVALVILGSSSLAGWVGNITFLDDMNEHATFLSSAQSAVKTLNSHLNGYLESGQERKLLITGHSRGAAAANLAADMINAQYGGDWENIYAYTYATPKAAQPHVVAAAASRNTNIFNIVNFYDLVGYVPGCYVNHGMTMFYQTETDNYAPMYIIPLKEITTESLSAKRFLAAYGIGTAFPNVSRILGYHLMNYYVEDLWGIMPEQIYTYDAAMTYMEDGYRKAVAEAVKELGAEGAARLSEFAEYMADIAGDAGDILLDDFFPSRRYDLGGDVMFPLDLPNFFDQPVADFPLEINCPVDLKIYDENGVLIGEVKDDEILSGSEYFILSVVEDRKSLLLLENMTYIIEITGYDTGTMDLQLMHLDAEENPAAVSYADVPVSPDTTLTARVENGVLTLLDSSAQTIEPEILTGEDLQTVEIAIESDNDTVTTLGAGSYIAGQQVLLAAASSDEDAVFAGWYDGDTLISSSATACITFDRSVTLTPKFLDDINEDSILRVTCGSGQISATVVCGSEAVVYAVAYDDCGRMLWAGSADAFTGTVTIPAPASVLEQADDVRVFLLDHETLQPLCRYGS